MVESLLTALGREKARCHFFSRGWRDERRVERGAKKRGESDDDEGGGGGDGGERRRRRLHPGSGDSKSG